MLNAVHLEAVRFERTALREGFFAQVALVGPNTGVCACVSLQVEGVIEALAAKGAQVAFDVGMTLHVSI